MSNKICTKRPLDVHKLLDYQGHFFEKKTEKPFLDTLMRSVCTNIKVPVVFFFSKWYGGNIQTNKPNFRSIIYILVWESLSWQTDR